jgi:hypothetical protein
MQTLINVRQPALPEKCGLRTVGIGHLDVWAKHRVTLKMITAQTTDTQQVAQLLCGIGMLSMMPARSAAKTDVPQ